MSDTVNKRVRRTIEERIAEIDTQIVECWKQLKVIESKKQEAIVAFDGRISKVQDKVRGVRQAAGCDPCPQAASQDHEDQKAE